MIDDELLTNLFADSPMRSLKLPDRMLQPSTMAKLWINVFGNRRKLKDAADDLKKAKPLNLFPRMLTRVLEPEIIIGSLLLTREGRYRVFDERLPFNYDSWLNLMIQVHNRVIKKLPAVANPLESLGFDLSNYNIQMNEEKSRDVFYLKGLSYYISERAYLDLNADDKDLADFFVNTSLCEIGDFAFIVDFLDKYPFLKNRNKLLHEGAVDGHKDELAEFEEMEFSDFAAECATRLTSMAQVDRPGHLMNLVGVAQLVDKLVNDGHLGLRNELSKRINQEKQRLVDFVEQTLAKATLIPSLKDMPVWNECIALIANLKNDLGPSTLSTEASEAIADYCIKRTEFQETMIEFPDRLKAALEDFKRLKAEVAEEALRDDSDGDSILKKGAKVVEANSSLISTSDQAGTAFVTLLSGLSELWGRLNQANEHPLALTHEKPTLALAPPAETVSSEPEVDIAAFDQMVAQNKALLAKLEKVQVHLAEMEELTSNLEQENTTLKREHHILKQRLTFEPSRQTDDVPLDITDSTLVALITQNRTPNPEDILRFYQSVAPERIEVMDCAFESARDASDFHLPYRLSELLYKLLFDYLDMIKSGNPDSEARKIFGKGYSAKESETVTSNNRLRAMREFYYGGETVLFLQHLSVGRSYGTQRSIRVYFKIIEGKVVIAHCGLHFDTMQTN